MKLSFKQSKILNNFTKTKNHIESHSYVKALTKQHFHTHPCFSSTAFIRGTNSWIGFLIGTRSFAQIFLTYFIFIFSSVSDASGFPDLPS